MNTRLQVEHPVTEEITGQDLVEWQLRVASGEKLPLKQEELKINGWAMEARLYAENVDAGFLPSTGKLQLFRLPHPEDDGVRVDSAVAGDDEVTPFYDPMIAKIISHEPTRIEAIGKLRTSFEAIETWPVKSNAGFVARCLDDADFRRGDVDTGLIARAGERLSKRPPPSNAAKVAAAKEFARVTGKPTKRPFPKDVVWSPWHQLTGFKLNAAPRSAVLMRLDGEAIAASPSDDTLAHAFIWREREQSAFVTEVGEIYEFTLDTGERSADEATAGDGAILSPMPGKIVSVAAKAGAKLKKGDPILVLEAMKMEHTLTAPFDGKLAELNAKAGAQVSEGVLLAKLEKED
jgi:acetyl/propionyl-CoA carboxylase alpha subunit